MKIAMLTTVVSILQMTAVWFIGKKYECIKKELNNHRQITILVVATILTATMNALLFKQPEYNWLMTLNFIVIYTVVLVSGVVDLYCHKIPNIMLLIGMIARIVVLIIMGILFREMVGISLIMSLSGGIISLLVLLLISILSKKGIGYGDVKLYACLGFFLGIMDTYYILFYAVLAAAIYAAYIVLSKKGDRKTHIPFGPFTYLGFVTVYMLSFLQIYF